MITDKAEINAAIEAQAKYCKEHKLPHFAPYNGHCLYCGMQIYKMIPKEKAENHLITHCPFCNKSYCD